MIRKQQLIPVFLIGLLLINSRILQAIQPVQVAGDTIIRVGLVLNGTSLPDSIYLAVLADGFQVEARKFMEAIKGSYYPCWRKALDIG